MSQLCYASLMAKSKIEVQKLSLSALVVSKLKNCAFIVLNHVFFCPVSRLGFPVHTPSVSVKKQLR